jgi:hypothetical protein
VLSVQGESNKVVLTFATPPFVGFITEAENRPALEAIVSGLEAARG